MSVSKYHAVEYRLKKYAKESAWSKYHRLKELAKHHKRCATSRQSVDNTCPHYSTHILVNRRRVNIEEDKMRVIEKNLMEMYERIKEVEEMPSQYAIVKKTYLSRGDSPWPKPPSRTTAEDKLDKVKKWEMKHHPKRVATAPTGVFAALFGTKTPEPAPSRPASAPAGDGEKPAPKTELDPNSISRVTEAEAEEDKKLEILKAVQEEGDPNF